jgi:hypothetical protein
MQVDPVIAFKFFRYLRETANNHGRRVEAVRHWGLGDVASSDSWCDFMAVGFILDFVFAGESPFPRTEEINGSTDAAMKYGQAQGWEVPLDRAMRGDLIFSIHPPDAPEPGKAHHVAMLEDPDTFQVIAGNTSEDGISSNGDRVAEHVVSKANKVAIQYPRGTERPEFILMEAGA